MKMFGGLAFLIGGNMGIGASDPVSPLGLHEPRIRQAPALGPAHARYARTIPTDLPKITRAGKVNEPDQARSAMLDHVEQWARLSPRGSRHDGRAALLESSERKS